MGDISSGDIMGAINSAKAVAAEAVNRGNEAMAYTKDTLLTPAEAAAVEEAEAVADAEQL